MTTGTVDESGGPSAAAAVRIDARPALLLAQMPGRGPTHVTSQSQAGEKVHQPLPATAQTCSYRVNDSLMVDADRSSEFVVLTDADGDFLVVALNEGVVVRSERHGDRQVELAPHEAVLARSDGELGIRVVPTAALGATEAAVAAGLLDRVAEAMAARPGWPAGGTVRPVETVPAGGDAFHAEEPTPFGRYLVEMLLTGVAIALVLAVVLLVMG